MWFGQMGRVFCEGGRRCLGIGRRRTTDCAAYRNELTNALIEPAPATRLLRRADHRPHTRIDVENGSVVDTLANLIPDGIVTDRPLRVTAMWQDL